MPDPAWPSSPPEVNYLRLIGPGAAGTATTLASSAVWQALTIGNEVAFSASTVNTAATATDFEGVGGVGSITAAGGLNSALQLLAGWAQEKPPIAASAVAAYETAVSAMIPAEVAVANRTEQAADVALNPMVLGALTPAIVALDTVYFGEFWPQNASSGVAYGAALAALAAALTVPPPLSPPGAAAAAPVTAASAVAESAGQAVAGAAMKESTQLIASAGGGAVAPTQAAGQAVAGILQPVTGMFQAPMQAAQSLAGMPQSMMGALAGSLGTGALGTEEPPALFGAAGATASGTGIVGSPAGAAGGSVGAAGAPSAGLTSYSRPPSAFPRENTGRPTALKAGLLSADDLKMPTSAGMSGGPMPMAPAHGGAQGHAKGDSGKGGIALARIVIAPANGQRSPNG